MGAETPVPWLSVRQSSLVAQLKSGLPRQVYLCEYILPNFLIVVTTYLTKQMKGAGLGSQFGGLQSMWSGPHGSR